VWAGVDSVWEQEKLEARKMFVNAARAKRSPTRQVHIILVLLQDALLGSENDHGPAGHEVQRIVFFEALMSGSMVGTMPFGTDDLCLQRLAILQDDNDGRQPQDDTIDQEENRSQFHICQIGREKSVGTGGAGMH